jgi:hypothetical protein
MKKCSWNGCSQLGSRKILDYYGVILKRKNEKRRANFSGGASDLMGWRSIYPA